MKIPSIQAKDGGPGKCLDKGPRVHMKTITPRELAHRAALKHIAVHGHLDHYSGIVTLHALTRLAAGTGDTTLIREARELLLPFVRGERQFHVNFPNYLCGGNASAYLLWRGHLPEAAESARRYAEEILNCAPRDPDGILSHPQLPGRDCVWIDVAFAVTPFLLFTGLALNEGKYIEEAFQQTAKMVRLFLDSENGLLHQSRGFNGPGKFSEDHWSRGNGWGALALTELACHLPDTHPRKEEALKLYDDHLAACARFQDERGLWHQEITELKRSYVETSGSGLLLYAVGAGLEAGILDASHQERFEQGLRGLLDYISADFDIYHTCRGCLCPGQGTMLEYMAHPAVPNDPHAFGPVSLAAGQAHLLGISRIDPLPKSVLPQKADTKAVAQSPH